MAASKKLIIDCDTGVDDAQAILLALCSSGVDILAITCTDGNVTVDQAATNTARVLHAAGVSHIPIYKGAEKAFLDMPLLETQHSDASKYHGEDGLGDVPGATVGVPDAGMVKEGYAAVEICRLVNKYPGEVTLVAIGPLTNLGLAFRLDGGVAGKLKDLYIMGGSIYAKGNVSVIGEFNVSKDPESAAVVLKEARCPTYLFSWEMCCLKGVDWDWHSDWISRDTPLLRFLKQITAHTCQMDREVWGTEFCPPDLVTMAIVLDNDIATKTELCHCYMDCGGNPLTRGQLIVDWRNLLGERKNISVCTDWSVDRFKAVLMSMADASP